MTRPARLVGRQPGQDRAGLVDGVLAAPRPGRVRPRTGGRDRDPQRALAAGLHDGVGGLHQDREVGLEQVGPTLREQLEPVVRRVDLLGLVEQVGHVVLRLRHRRRELEDDGVAALHVAGAEPAQHLAVERGGPVVVDRDGVEVAGHDDPLRPAQVGARDHGVAVPGHLQVRQRLQRPLDGVGDLLLVAAHRLDVDQRGGQAHDVRVKIDEFRSSDMRPILSSALPGSS